MNTTTLLMGLAGVQMNITRVCVDSIVPLKLRQQECLSPTNKIVYAGSLTISMQHTIIECSSEAAPSDLFHQITMIMVRKTPISSLQNSLEKVVAHINCIEQCIVKILSSSSASKP